MIARHKKPRHDLIVVLHSKSCDAAEKVVARLLKTRDHRGGDSTVNRTYPTTYKIIKFQKYLKQTYLGVELSCRTSDNMVKFSLDEPLYPL